MVTSKYKNMMIDEHDYDYKTKYIEKLKLQLNAESKTKI